LRRLVEFLNAKMNDVEVLAVEVKQFLGKGQRAMVPRVIGITEATRRAKQEFPRRMTNRQEFLEACEPETRAFYSKLIDKRGGRIISCVPFFGSCVPICRTPVSKNEMGLKLTSRFLGRTSRISGRLSQKMRHQKWRISISNGNFALNLRCRMP
jgi:hypothetical protein